MILLEIFGQSPIEGPGTGSFTDHLIEIVAMLLVAFLLGLWVGRVAVSRLKSKLNEATSELELLKTEVEAIDDRKLEIASLNEKVRLLEDRNSKLRIQANSPIIETDTKTLDLKISAKDDEIGKLTKEIEELKQLVEANKVEAKSTPSFSVSNPVTVTKSQSEKPTVVSPKTPETEANVKVDSPIEESAKVSEVTVNTSSKKSDLKKIEGVGPKIEQLLNADYVLTFDDVIETGAEKIREILLKAGPQYKVHDPSTWAEQAQLARDEKWDELLLLQNELKGGKKV